VLLDKEEFVGRGTGERKTVYPKQSRMSKDLSEIRFSGVVSDYLRFFLFFKL
jgi:hypothetical protein